MRARLKTHACMEWKEASLKATGIRLIACERTRKLTNVHVENELTNQLIKLHTRARIDTN